MSETQMTGAKALIKVLEAKGVDTIFGYPGGANLPIYDELRDSEILHVLARHEQGAVHMAEGYARVANRAGVCLATSGPGATNIVTGLADALLDSVPLVAITGQIPRAMIGTDAFQEVDCLNITMPVTKHNELVANEADVVPSLEAAFYIANSGRKGPVLLDYPSDVLLAEYPHSFDHEINLPGYKPTTVGNVGQVKKALKILAKAERPLIVFGGGVVLSRAEQELINFAHITNIPCVRTLMGTGVFDDTDPLMIGMIGTHGNSIANKAVQREADAIMVIGSKLGNRSIVKAELFGKNATVIHLDIDPAEIGKWIEIDIPIVGDIKTTLQAILQRVEKKPLGHMTPWLTSESRTTTMLPKTDWATVMEVVFKELSLIDRKLHVSTDVGRHQLWANHHCTNPKHLPLITSGGLGTMGFGVPAAIGAWFADKETPVVSLSGDGSFMMTMQEFLVAVEHNVPLTVCILNDSRLGMIRELQSARYGKRFITHQFPKTTNFAMIAEAFGGVGVDVHHKEQIGSALNKAINSGNQTIISFDLERIEATSHLSLSSAAS